MLTHVVFTKLQATLKFKSILIPHIVERSGSDIIKHICQTKVTFNN